LRISTIVDIHIKEYSAGSISVMSSYAKNAVYDQYPDGDWFAEQRPGINVSEDASISTSDTQGRGIYYWEAVSQKYFVNNDTVYQSTYGGSTMTITAGTEPVYIFEVGDYLVLLDPENNEGWTIHSGTPTVIAQITDVDFPTEQIPALTLAKGGAVLNGKLFVFTTDGDIYGSDINDPTSWNGLNFRNAEVEPDGGIYLGEHHQHIVAIGNRSLEFFYWANNPTGSVISPRTDIDWAIGAVDRYSFWEEADLLFWVGFTASGGVSVYSLQDFTPVKISTYDIDTFLGDAVTTNSAKLLGSGLQVGGRIYYILTIYYLSNGNVSPTTTLVYELTSNKWYLWELEHPGINDCPIARWTKSTETRLGEGILSNGDLITPSGSTNAQDTFGDDFVFEADVFESGVFAGTSSSGTDIGMEIVTGQRDFGNRKYKYQSELWSVHTPTVTTQTLNVRTSDESDTDWSDAMPIDTSDVGDRIRRLGRFRQRNYKLTYQSAERISLEGIETTEQQGTA